MAATPPLQIRQDAHTPSTPLHGAGYDNLNSPPHRHSTRLTQRRISRDSRETPEAAQVTPRKTRSVGTPASSRRVSQNSESEPSTNSSPRCSPKHKSARRVQILSPSSPDFGSAVPKPVTATNSHLTIFSSSTTTMSDGMLPTPVKTPKKKNIPKISPAARALFQDQPIIGEDVGLAPRRARKQRRYNGFSLESFNDGGDGGRGRIQIFTDSRDQVPQADTHGDNPFLDPQANADGPSVRRLTSSSKRRKISGEKKKDPQVEGAIKDDEGMVYVFRGKKVYRRFDDADDEEEVINVADLGLLNHTPGGSERIVPLKTLTRKSIKPKRLFQTEQQKRAREIEKEEEAATDIEDHGAINSVLADVPSSCKSSGGIETIDSVTSAQHGHSLRSNTKKEADTESQAVEQAKNLKAKRGSPFDTWKRVKSGGGAAAVPSGKSKKRVASEMTDEGETTTKKVKGG